MQLQDILPETEFTQDSHEKYLTALTGLLHEICRQRLFSLVAVGSVGRAYSAQLPASQLTPEDYDLIAILDAGKITTAALQHRMNQLVTQRNREQRTSISLGVLRRSELRRLPFTLFNYELRYGYRVLYGHDPTPELPTYAAEHMPLIEASRLLLNRGVLLWGDSLRVRGPALTAAESAAIAARNRKAVMGMGDALLIADGRFHYSYQIRIDQALQCELFDRIEPCALRQQYIRATTAKLGGEPIDNSLVWETEALLTAHEQVLRLVEQLRLKRRLDDWREYSGLDLLYPSYLRGHWFKRLARLVLTFGLPRLNGFYRQHLAHGAEEVLLLAFPSVAYHGLGDDFLPAVLNWSPRTSRDINTVWRRFRRLWREGR